MTDPNLLITDLSLANKIYSGVEIGGVPQPIPCISFTYSTTKYFNYLGVMAGPAMQGDGVTPNTCGPVTVTLTQQYVYGSPGQSLPVVTLATAIVDLTDAIPGQMIWATDDLPPFPLIPGDSYGQRVYTIHVQISAADFPYYFYAGRPCTVQDGVAWGTGSASPSGNYQLVGVNLTLATYDPLVGDVGPDVALAGVLLRRGELRPKTLEPQITLSGGLWRAGVLGGDLAAGEIVLANPGGMVGGPLWKPAKLCSG
jgi:hypothetical protein